MKPRVAIIAGALALAGVAGTLSGCEDAAKNSVKAQRPATSSKQASPNKSGAATATAKNGNGMTGPAKADIPTLPLHAEGRRPVTSLAYPVKDSRGELIVQVERKFASGQQDYKAGHLEAARKDFDDAVD